MKTSYIIIFSAVTMSTILVIAYAVIALKPWREMTSQAKKRPRLWMESWALDPCNRPIGNVTLLELQDRKHQLEIEELRRRVVELQEKINVTVAQIDTLEKNGMSCQEEEKMDAESSCGVDPYSKWIVDEEKKKGVAEQFSEDEIIRLSTPQTFIPNEYEALRWESFTSEHIYHFQEGTSPVPKQNQRREYTGVISQAVRLINKEKNTSQTAVTSDDLVDGLSLFSRTRGTLYRLYFRTQNAHTYRLTEFFQPFGRARQLKDQTTIDASDVWIHVILTLQGRIDRFRAFVKMYVDVCVKKDKKVFLTVVYFGKNGQKEAENILKDMAGKNNYKNYKFLTLNSKFSRGRGLQYGAERLDRGRVLMFFCDVDIEFDKGFLDRCRIHAQPGRVYFPIVFSLYNPDVVYGKSQVQPQKSRLVIKHETGSWRKYGYGMACLYRKDFFSVGGFNLNIEGWGGEDVDLVKRFKCSNLKIVRAVDRGIFHLYHEKLCDVGLSKEKFGHCVGNRAIYEASHRQLGLKVLNLTDER